MKKILFAAIVSVCTLNLFAADPGVNEKVLSAFNNTFKNAENVSWSTSKYTYEVRFQQNLITAKITYDKEGNILRTLRYYNEDQLPILVLTKVKNRFSDKRVYGVVEESSEEGTYYHITLEDEKNWFEIKSDNYGSLTLEKKFRKA
ncbi:MAG: PepSY-like domain-containing protein [Flavisolibacter sp.]|jgi:hypothetical protein